MEKPAILLASASPRRRRLMAWLGVPYAVTSVDTPEDLAAPAGSHVLLACSLAAEKADAARAAGAVERSVLALDTIVVLDAAALGKPRDEEDARRMLRSLSGREHEVVTGVAISVAGEPEPRTFGVTTRVRMKVLDEAAIGEWIARGEALGCAGAYNIEGQVAEVTSDECHQNVAGLPLCHLYAHLRALAPDGLTSPIATCDAALGRTCRLGPSVIACG